MTDYHTTDTRGTTVIETEKSGGGATSFILFILGGVVALLGVIWIANGVPGLDSGSATPSAPSEVNVTVDTPAPSPAAPAESAPAAEQPAAPAQQGN